MSDTLDDVAKNLTELLKKQALDLIQNNKDTALDLTDSLVKALLDNEINSLVLKAIPIFVGDNPTPAQIAQRESILADRSRALQLVMEAEERDAERVAKLKKSVIGVVGKIASSVGGVVITGLTGALAGA